MNESDFELLKQERNQAMRIANSNAIACVELEGKCEEYLDKIARFEAECAALKAEAEIGAAVNRACKDLPDGYVIVIYLENGAGEIQLQCPDDNFSRSDFEHEADTFGGQINAAIDDAMQAGEKP